METIPEDRGPREGCINVSVSVYYDGLCLLCRRAVRFLKRIDVRDAITLRDANALMLDQLPDYLREADFDAAMYAWDGKTLFRGYDAFAAAFRHIPGWSFIGAVMTVPMLRFFGVRVYSLVARNRRRLGCRI